MVYNSFTTLRTSYHMRIVYLFTLTVFSFHGASAVPPQEPIVSGASQDAGRAMTGFRVPNDLTASLVAAEPEMANPVAFFVDHKGRIFVCESYRQGKAIEDNRGHPEWLDEDLAAQTVADRIAYVKRHLGEGAEDYTKFDDRIRLLTDTNHDGKIDQSVVFADRFNEIESGTGAGVLVRGDSVYYTCIPDLWLLKDNDHDGVADERKSLSSGYGVRFAFRGHDLHGLVLGPDGRLYFSVGDRGLNVSTPNGALVNPESGAVLRCERDGSHLELFATGLRNPQELAFDDYGNLFTGDNNSDSGDKARIVYVMEGSDSGWRMAYQYFPDRGPFGREKLWYPHFENQAAYIVPPITNLSDGPSGFAYYPGVGLGEKYSGRFFLADFRGTPVNSGVRTFRLRERGAGFEIADEEQTVWGILATDLDFSPEGDLLVSDWVNGWVGEGRGRIYRFATQDEGERAKGRAVAAILAEGFSHRDTPSLVALLGHADRRVRLESQLELVERKASSEFAKVAASADHSLLARLHAIWGLGILSRHEELAESEWSVVKALARDAKAEIRAQIAKTFGSSVMEDELIALLSDESTRVRSFAANSLSRTKSQKALSAIVHAIRENADADPYLRHACVMGLVGCASDADLKDLKTHDSRSVRLATLLALRRKKDPFVAEFLLDSVASIRAEAARAIYDEPIVPAMAALAAAVPDPFNDDESFIRRVIGANLRKGDEFSAKKLAGIAASDRYSEVIRLEALEALGQWSKPSSRDLVLGMWRPMPRHEEKHFLDAVKSQLAKLLTGPPLVRNRATAFAVDYHLAEAVEWMNAIVEDAANSSQERARNLEGLASLGFPGATKLALRELDRGDSQLRASARRVLLKLSPDQGFVSLEKALSTGELIERQAAIADLSTSRDPRAIELIAKSLKQLSEGSFARDCALDVMEAGLSFKDEQLDKKVAEITSARRQNDPLSEYFECVEGGDAEKGKNVFFERIEVSCVRCHKVGTRGGDVGPNLTQIAKEKSREYLLESLVDPTKTIAKGFESVQIVDEDGKVFSGVLRAETADEIQLVTPEAQVMTIPKSRIDERTTGKSAMPDDLAKKLSRREIRDLVEYLYSLK